MNHGSAHSRPHGRLEPMRPVVARVASRGLLAAAGAGLCFTLSVMFAPGVPMPLRFGSYDRIRNPHPFVAIAILLVSALVVAAFGVTLVRSWIRATFVYLIVASVALPLLIGDHLSGDGLWALNVPFALVPAVVCGLVAGRIAEPPPPEHIV